MGWLWQKLFVGKAAAWTAIFTLVLTVVAVLSYKNYTKTNEISVNTQRAFITLKSIQGMNLTDSKSQKLAGLQFFVEFENSGTTPTKNAFVQSNVQVWRTELPKGFGFEDLAKTGKHSSMSIGPKASVVSGPLNVDMDNLNDVMQKKSHLYFWGWVTYHDIFSNTPTRLTEFCSELEVFPVAGNPEKTMFWRPTPCSEHNCFDEDCDDYQSRIKRPQ
jgi:hypothetical protein